MKYDETSIQVLSQIEHIQTNPGMYIGNTTDPTSLVEEILDNALDESESGFSTVILLKIDTKNNIYSCYDNGRGIPINKIDLVCSKLFSGAKFKNKKSAYRISLGMHGVGLVAVNALSEFMEVIVYRESKIARLYYEKSILKSKEINEYSKKPPFSTGIIFKPSKKYFDNLIPDLDFIEYRLKLASSHLNNTKIILDIDSKTKIIKATKNEIFNNLLISDENEYIPNKPLFFEVKDNIESMNVMFCYCKNGTKSPKILSDINLLPVDGGNHVLYFQDILKEIFDKQIKKYSLNPNDVLLGLRCYIQLFLENPSFSSQIKDKLTSRRSELKNLFEKMKEKIISYFNSNKDLFDEISQFFIDYRMSLDSKKIVNSVSNRVITKFTKLRDCNSKNGELYIVEGQSAAGSLLQARDPKIHAVMPLKGKIPTIINKKDILKNEEISEIIQALGTGIGKEFDISKLRYDKIILLSDYDEDGKHITCLVLLMLAILMPELIKNGKVYVCITPLYAINENKKFIPLWTNQELEEARKKKYNITRFKGLGEFSPWQLKIVALDKNRKLIQVKYSDKIENIIKLFSDVNYKRKLLEDIDKWTE